MSKNLRLVTSASEVPVDEVNPVPPYSVWYDGEKVYFFPDENHLKTITYKTSDGKIIDVEKLNGGLYGRDIGFYSLHKTPEGEIDGYIKWLDVNEVYNNGTGYFVLHPLVKEGIEGIGRYTFSNAKTLTKINFPKGLYLIRLGAFWGCEGLTSIVLPDKLEIIEEQAFYLCKGLRSITFGQRIRKIGEYAFSFCGNLPSIILPSSIEKIEKHAFGMCHNLASVWYDNIEYRSKAALIGALLANGVELGDDPFYETALES